MKHDYGPPYERTSETRSYVQHFLSDVMTDGAEPAIDAIVQISFESVEQMRTALQRDDYREAHKMREEYMRETSVGTHTAVVDEMVTFR
jgi:uncharacterized protein (DUF1330 family)